MVLEIGDNVPISLAICAHTFHASRCWSTHISTTASYHLMFVFVAYLLREGNHCADILAKLGTNA